MINRNDRNKYLHNKIALSHLFYIFILLAIILQHLNLDQVNGVLKIASYYLWASLLFIIDGIFFILIEKRRQLENLTFIGFIYFLLPFAATVFVLLFTGTSKGLVLLVLPVLIAGSGTTKKQTYIMGALCLLAVIFITLINNPAMSIKQVVNLHLPVMCVLVLTAWFSGTLSEIEFNHRSQLNELVYMDELTGISNHRAFSEEVTRLQSHENKYSTLSAIFIDIDDFKVFNETFGHIEGDQILATMGRIIGNITIPNSLTARYGGEEFVVLIKDCSSNYALDMAEMIRDRIEKMTFATSGRSNKITVSCGVCTLPGQAKTVQELLVNTDHALYKAKSLGKNRVEVYSSVFDDIISSDDSALKSIQTLIHVINAKDSYTYGHSERVVEYCTLIGNALQLNNESLMQLRWASYLHDIGKIEIDRSLVNKPEKLTEDEFKTIKKHPVWGCSLVQGIPELKDVSPVILYHHENYDGSGYPSGIKGKDIPFLSRIIRVADSFDAMTSDRPYRSSLTLQAARFELQKGAGKQFDPQVVSVFQEILNRL
ncbi:MAG: HD domain-containing phosphohydrolase [Methylocystaceae bacterium]